jgi:DNA-binding transcriptional regulator YiaG
MTNKKEHTHCTLKRSADALRNAEKDEQVAKSRVRLLSGQFGIDVRAMRATVGIGLREFAKDLGISAAYLCDLELGRSRSWTGEDHQLNPRTTEQPMSNHKDHGLRRAAD